MRGKRFIIALLAGIALFGQASLAFFASPTPVAQAAGNVDQFCKGNSTQIKGVSLTVTQNPTDPYRIDASYTVDHASLVDGQNIGVALFSTKVVGGVQTNFVEENQVSHLDPDSDQRKKVSPTQSKGSFVIATSPTDDGDYKYVLLAYGPDDAGNSSTAVDGSDVAKNKCSSVVDYTAKFDTTNPPPPTNVSVGFNTPSEPDGGNLHLSWNWQWIAGKTATFDIVYSSPSSVSYPLSKATASPSDPTFFFQDITLAATTGTVVFALRATVDGVQSILSGTYTFTYGADGKLVSVTDPKGNVETRDQIIAGSPIAGAGDQKDRCGQNAGLSPSTWGLIIPYVFCEVTVVIMDVGEFFLDMSATLLLETSNIPGSMPATNNVFTNINKNTFLGPIEDKLVDNQAGQLTRNAYNYILGLCNTAVLLLLIVIALANILQVQVNTYSLKKLLPGLIIGLLLANLSFFIIRAGLELSGELTSGLVTQLNKGCGPASGGATSGNSAACGFDNFRLAFHDMGSVKHDPNAFLTKDGTENTPADYGLVFQQFVLNFFLGAAVIMVFILACLFMVRSFIFYFATAVAPFAFLGLYFPPISFVWKRWSALVVSWIFMPLVAFFWIWMGLLWFKAVPVDTSSFMTYMLGYIFGMMALWAAVKTPFTLAGEAKGLYGKLESKVNGAPKALWGATGAKSVEAVKSRAMATPLGDAKRYIDRLEENRKKRNEQYNKGYSPRGLKKVNEAKKDIEIQKQKAEGEIRILEDKKKRAEEAGELLNAHRLGTEIENIQKTVRDKEIAFQNGDGMNRGMRRALRIKKQDKRHDLEKEEHDVFEAGLGATAEEQLAVGTGRQADHYRELKDAIKDSQQVTKEVAELVRSTNEKNYTAGRVHDKRGARQDELVKQWRLESNMRTEGLKKSLDKEAEDNLKQTQYLNILRGEPVQRTGEGEEAFGVRKQIYKSAEKAVRDSLREEVGKRKENVNALTDDTDDVSKELKLLLASPNKITDSMDGKRMENRLKAAAEYVARYEDVNRQANSNSDRMDLEVLQAGLETILHHTQGLDGTNAKAKQDNDLIRGMISKIQAGVNPGDRDSFRNEIKDFIRNSQFVKDEYRNIMKDANNVMRDNPKRVAAATGAAPAGGTPPPTGGTP